MQRMLELDYAIREALGARDSEAVLRLAAEHYQAIQAMLDKQNGVVRERLVRQAADLLAETLRIARQVREHLREELNMTVRQRQLAGNHLDSAPTRSYWV